MTRCQATSWVVAAALLTAASAVAADWPQWRGPNRDGVWRQTGVVERFEGPQLKIRWRAKIANGYSGPTVADGRAYVTDRTTKPAPVERVHCFDAMSGKRLWSHQYECRYQRVGYPNGPRAAVTLDGGRAYSVGAMGHLVCLDAEKGNVIWSKNPGIDYTTKMPIWGIAAAPLVEADKLIVQISGEDGACIVAFDKVTGKELWRALDEKASYSSPIVITQAEKRVLVCLTEERLVGMDSGSGKLYWEQPFKSIQNVATPVVHGNHVFVSSFFDGSMLVRLHTDKPAASIVWRRKGASEKDTDSLHCCISTPVLQGEHIYGVDSYGELRCLELQTGDRVWKNLDAVPTARWANIHMVQNRDKAWMFNERGELIIGSFSPNGFEQISRTQVISPTKGQLGQRGGVCWSHPAFAYKHVYVRNDEELICADLSAKN